MKQIQTFVNTFGVTCLSACMAFSIAAGPSVYSQSQNSFLQAIRSNNFASATLRVSNPEGIFLRDNNCNKTHILKQNSLIEAYFNIYTDTYINCEINGAIYTLHNTNVITGRKGGSSYYGYSYINSMTDAGNMYVYEQTLPLLNNSVVRDSECQRITTLSKGTQVEIISDGFTSPLLCSINGVYYPMHAINSNGTKQYIAASNLQTVRTN